MPNIKPISDLRNYGKVLSNVAFDAPVFLTKNGHGEYAVLAIEEYNFYQKLRAKAWLENELHESIESEKNGLIDAEEVFSKILTEIEKKD